MSKPLANFWKRVSARILDLFTFYIPLAVIITYIFGEDDIIGNNIYSILSILYVVVAPIICKGVTIGKKVLRIKILKLNGENVTLLTMIKREILSLIIYIFSFGILYFVSIIMVIVRDDRRALHDLIAKTKVIEKAK